MKSPKTLLVVAFIAAGILSFTFRFNDLGRSAVRSDEINFLNLAERNQSLVELWKNPPWMNQIPLADSIAIVWHWIRPGVPDEQSVREPFALIGWLTVIGMAGWLYRRKQPWAAVMAALWMGLLPFHVYQSREAYYYVLVMACSGAFTLYAVDLLVKLRAHHALSLKNIIAWALLAWLTCMTHMSTWVVAGVVWLLLVISGLRSLPPAEKKRHITYFVLAGLGVGLAMSRWIYRALQEMVKVSNADGHIGSAFGWVGPRVLPFFSAGANAIGVALLITSFVCGCILLVRHIKSSSPSSSESASLHLALSMVVLAGLAASYAYIGLVGGGAAKISYFTALLPAFLVWCSTSIDGIITLLPRPARTSMRVIIPLVITALLWQPTTAVGKLEGKPVPYKTLRDWLDNNLEKGSVAVVDRWFEPWNEMARYAPTNVVVTFTVPDEPYSNYEQLRWRDVTRQAIENGAVQAFIRLTRNHEERAGLWTWPETYFKRHARIENSAGIWLREKGYAPVEDFYAANSNRIVVEVFYDLKEDAINRHRENSDAAAVLFDATLPYEKSGPMGIFRFQTQQFMDWRVLNQRGELEVYNLTDAPLEATLEITAVAPRGAKLVTANGQRSQFAAGQMQRWSLGPLRLEPGRNPVILEDPRWGQSMEPLLISSVKVVTP